MPKPNHPSGKGPATPNAAAAEPIIPENYVDFAEQLMKENCALITKTKIQNLLRLACDVYNNENRRTEERLLKESVNQIKLLRIRLAYECGRDPQVRQFVESANLFEYLAKLSSVGTCTRQDLIDYYHYMEALVAFHRYYSESKTGEENAS